jgi:hypothetical protein
VRTIKTLGIATAVALALIAVVGASAASASEFQAEGEVGTITLSGARGLKSHSLKLGSDWFTCKEVAFSGQMTGPNASEVTVGPELGCTWQAGSPAVWATHGCKYRLHPGSSSETGTVGSLDITGCTSPMFFKSSGCEIEVGNQNRVGTLEYKNTVVEGKAAIKVNASLTGIIYTRRGPCTGLSGTYSDGTYTGEWIVKGSNSKSEIVNVGVYGTAPPPPSKFVAQEPPATITAETLNPTNGKFLTFPKDGGLPCGSTGSTESATGEAGSFTITPTLSGCSFNGSTEAEGVSVSMGGCSFKYSVSGSFEITGATCASNPIKVNTTRAAEECTVTVGPQGPLSGLSFANEGTGTARVVRMTSGPVKGLTYTAAGPHCLGPGTFSDGEYKQTLKFKATNSEGEARGIWVE